MNSNILTSVSPYIYGTTRLGDDSIPVAERIEVARAAMNAGVWFHTSHQYNSALEILGAAFEQDRTKVPNLIIKMGGNSVAEMIDDVKRNLKPLGVESLEIGQLCMWDDLSKDFAEGGVCLQDLRNLK